ncbi:MAG: hypothetical protein QOJ38_1819 [Solirubrobacterales bacterium]|jgi:hypothetical protein|nr:hypothetical protein [Solirubrobacterales bacterium]
MRIDRVTGWPLALVAVVLFVVILIAWPQADGGAKRSDRHLFPVHPARGPINEIDGSYAGVRLREPIAQARRRFRDRLPVAESPVIDQESFPGRLPADTPKDDVYPDAEMTQRHGRVASILVYGAGARTSRGIAVGDSLDLVRQRYPRASCESAGTHGGEFFHSADCEVQVAPYRYVYFGDDPIRLIVLTYGPS